MRLPDPKPAAEAEQVAAKAKPDDAKRPLSGLPANELGQVPVVMHHMIRPDRVGEYDQTPAEFRAELEYLWQHGYVPVNVGDLLCRQARRPGGHDARRLHVRRRHDVPARHSTAAGR